MEKENKDLIIITTPIKKLIQKKQLDIKYDIEYLKTKKNIINRLINTQKQQVTIYDITHNKKTPPLSQIQINNHINKTGENPLRGKQKRLNIGFLDITKIYKKEEGEVITTTSLGKKYNKHKQKEKTPSTYMSNIAILCLAAKIENIKGVLINKLD